jgi:hypothetical protein
MSNTNTPIFPRQFGYMFSITIVGWRRPRRAGARGHGTKDRNPAVKARAEALSRLREEQKREGQSALDGYLKKEKAERAKMAKLSALRLATEAEAGVRPRVKRKGGGKAKRT